MMLDLEDHRWMQRFGEALIDPGGELAYTRLVRPVFLYMDARRRRDLDERELADPLRLDLEQPLDRPQALLDPLRVVHPFDADPNGLLGRQVVALADLRAALLHRRGAQVGRGWAVQRNGMATIGDMCTTERI